MSSTPQAQKPDQKSLLLLPVVLISPLRRCSLLESSHSSSPKEALRRPDSVCFHLAPEGEIWHTAETHQLPVAWTCHNVLSVSRLQTPASLAIPHFYLHLHDQWWFLPASKFTNDNSLTMAWMGKLKIVSAHQVSVKEKSLSSWMEWFRSIGPQGTGLWPTLCLKNIRSLIHSFSSAWHQTFKFSQWSWQRHNTPHGPQHLSNEKHFQVLESSINVKHWEGSRKWRCCLKEDGIHVEHRSWGWGSIKGAKYFALCVISWTLSLVESLTSQVVLASYCKSWWASLESICVRHWRPY